MKKNNCHNCHKCMEEVYKTSPEARMFRRMILCPDCGNKRCPKASDHELACTKSNKSGQKGSVYPAFKA
jgi:hypothetical protein